MRIHHHYRDTPVSIAEAIEGSLDGSSYDTGRLEGIQSSQQLIAAMLGAIVERLHAKGALSDADIIDMLSWRYTARPDVSE